MDAVKEEVQKLGGSIMIQSKEDEGTQFSFKIPLPETT